MFKEKARNKMLRALMCIWYYIRCEAEMFLAENRHRYRKEKELWE